MSTKKWSALIPVENLGTQKKMEVIIDIPKSVNTSGNKFDRKEVGNE